MVLSACPSIHDLDQDEQGNSTTASASGILLAYDCAINRASEGRGVSEVTERFIHCPYCGESISVMVDDSEAGQQYTEDCQVCCRPMVMDVAVDDDGSVSVRARTEND